MPIAELNLIKRCAEFKPISEIKDIPYNTRGIYVLYKFRPKNKRYDVLYIGMAGGLKSGVRGRLNSHKRLKTRWTHFSLFEVHDNISVEQVTELEGILRHIFRKDTRKLDYMIQGTFKKLVKVGVPNLQEWKNKR